MNNVSLQLQQYRALKAQATHENNGDQQQADATVPLRHPEKTDFFQNLMQRWETSYLASRIPFMASTKVPAEAE